MRRLPWRKLVVRWQPERPVFLFGCSWRCGSTLLQRYLNSTEAVFVWGENRRLVGRLRHAAAMIDGHAHHSDDERSHLARSGHLAWIPLLAPQKPATVPLLRGALLEYYGGPTRARRTGRWGFKEVRENAATAAALLAAFPQGRVLFLQRDLAAVLASFAVVGWPEDNGGARRVAEQWLDSMTGFAAATDPRILTVRYETLVADPGPTTQAIAAHIGVPAGRFDRGLFKVRVGAAAVPPALGDEERALLADPRFAAARAAAGYA